MFSEHLATLAKAFDSAGIDYMIIGGQAVLAHGEPRLTQDVDATIAGGAEQLPGLLEVLKNTGWKPIPADPLEFVNQTLVLPCEDPVSGIRTDFIFGMTVYEQKAMKRAEVRWIEGVPVRFATAADLIVHKIIAGRPRDLEDVAGVIAKNPNLDRVWIVKILQEFEQELDEPLVERFEEIWRMAREG